MTEVTQSDAGWLSREDMDSARERLPILYVDVVPVRVDDQGTVTKVGLLLRAGSDGQIKRALVSGRVLYHERVRAALLRHMEKDLGPLALPRIPPAPQPFTVAEYFPTPGVTPSGRWDAVMAEVARLQSEESMSPLAALQAVYAKLASGWRPR